MTQLDASNWMSASLETLGPLSLQRIVMPASHDSGMYEVNQCTPDITVLRKGPYGANACNTQTQVQNIQDQLGAGSRYFDIRPVLHDGQMYTGHYALKSPITLGCNGPTLQDYFAQVASFMAGSGDLVILKFSHYYNRDAALLDRVRERDEHGFDSDDFTTLVNGVKSALGPWLYTGDVPDGGLITQDLQGFIGNGGRVLAVFDDLPSDLHDPSAGIYTYADAPGSGDLVVYDEYADKPDLKEMISDQKTKLTNTDNHQGCLFLLSWTLTQDGKMAAACGLNKPDTTSILSLADEAKAALDPVIKTWVENSVISQATLPNLIYVDANDTFSLQTALYLNQQFNGLPAS